MNINTEEFYLRATMDESCAGSIEEDEAQNLTQGQSLPDTPVEIASRSQLAYAMQSDSFFIRMYEITSCPKINDHKPRFLSTMGIFSCIAVFGWSPATGRAFAAHVPTSACHYAIRVKKQRRDLIPQITKIMRWTFRKEDISNVKAHLVGGQEFQDLHDPILSRIFTGEQRNFSWHVRKAIMDVGVSQSNIDEKYLNIFRGVPFNPSFEQEQASKNQSFQLAALDRVTGNVVVHTKSMSGTHYIVPSLEERGIAETNRYSELLPFLPTEGKACEFVHAKAE